MPPRVPNLSPKRLKLLQQRIISNEVQLCPFCSLSKGTRATTRPRRKSLQPQNKSRLQSTLATPSQSDIKITPAAAREKLRIALIDLQKHAGSYVNISRLQLALRGLDQVPGRETIRVAILGLSEGGNALAKAKGLLRLLLADPLSKDQEWEQTLTNHQSKKPLLIKVGQQMKVDEFQQGSKLLEEIYVSSPLLNGHNLEILVLEANPAPQNADEREETIADSILTPVMEIPTSSTGRYTPVTTPVHKSLIVADGIVGAASLVSYPVELDDHIIGTAVDLHLPSGEDTSSLPFRVINVSLGTNALRLFRESLDNAIPFERDWFAAGIPEIIKWLQAGTAPEEGPMKAPVRNLIHSVITNANNQIAAEKARRLEAALEETVSTATLDNLRLGLSRWSERAHGELQNQLDIAFSSKRWRKLGWWKLFWRVDDVTMIGADILNQKFLVDAEKEVIYLAGRIQEAGVFRQRGHVYPANWAYKSTSEEVKEVKIGSAPPAPKLSDLVEPVEEESESQIVIKPHPWPLHIPTTRRFLTLDSVPALQALAQKLVLQTLSTSGITSILSGLMYVSSVSTTVYEAGVVAAVGIVWSMRRMQTKWETARKYWEGEVREEGRKSIRNVETVVTQVLSETQKPIDIDDGLKDAEEALRRTEAALAQVPEK
ncbi:hypothetical protein F5884DRAFT_459396 [Xylogone sp. PMI_703]|nr:hypothetical protein F5884DRAFT_459396 [Xylogone sp. PMI_703]